MDPSRRFQPSFQPQSEARTLTESQLLGIEQEHPNGMTVQAIIGVFSQQGEKLTEATFRKYVQLGLLPRSVRVGRKGKHRGSQGLYPATTIRQIAHVRQLMRQGFTIEEIQREFVFVRAEIDALTRQLERVYEGLARAMRERGDLDNPMVARALADVRALGEQLLTQLGNIERRLSMRARMERAVV